MKDWLNVEEVKGSDRPVTFLELVEDKLPSPLNEKVAGEEFRIMYPDATQSAIYYLSILRDEDLRLTVAMFQVGAVGTAKQTDPTPLTVDVDSTLKKTFQLLQAYQSGEHYRLRAETRDIVLKILPLHNSKKELEELMTELRAQLAIDLL